jgi:selenocysteine lyase/cysteine desulfurase
MSPAAQAAQMDFARFAGEVGAAIRFDAFLREGINAYNDNGQARFPGLSTWRGVAALKESLRRLAGIDSNRPLLLASRSAVLMRFAAMLLCRPCENILVTDLDWPPYRRILEARCRSAHRRLTEVRLGAEILSGKITADEVAERLCREFTRNRCDGLFLTAVSNLGARLPVSSITLALRERCRFVVADGAQDFCHMVSETSACSCDLYIAGAHKWLGGFHPLGIAVYGVSSSAGIVETVLDELLCHDILDDPLLRFVEAIESGRSCDPAETVNLAGLISAAGAAADAEQMALAGQALQIRQENAARVAALAMVNGWRPQVPDKSLRTGILIFRHPSGKAKLMNADVCRASFQQQGIAMTVYEGGLLRLSMPPMRFTEAEVAVIGDAFEAVAVQLG